MNIKNILIPLGLALGPALAPGLAQAGVFCVSNGAEAPYLFAIETREGARATQVLAPSGALCMAGAENGGVVSVFENETVVEGCSRLVDDGQTEVMLAYSEFDRCRWSSNDG